MIRSAGMQKSISKSCLSDLWLPCPYSRLTSKLFSWPILLVFTIKTI